MPLSQFESQLYALLIEIKQTSATISADVNSLKTSIKSLKDELDEVENMCLDNKHDIIRLKSGTKAWMTAAAAVGGLVGWLLSIIKEVIAG